MQNNLKFVSLQYLRAIAAILVVVSHASHALKGVSPLLRFDLGTVGVDIFFVISGFIMVFTTHGRSQSPVVFFTKRLIRIAPLYLLLTTIAFLIARAYPTIFLTIPANWPAYLTSLVFIPHYNPIQHDISPLLNQGWTLNYEMFFYVLFAIGLLFDELRRVVFVSTILIMVSIIGLVVDPKETSLSFYTNSILLEFAFGMSLAYVFLNYPAWVSMRMPQVSSAAVATLIVVAIAGYLGLNLSSLPRFVVGGIPSLVLVSVFLMAEEKGYLPKWRLLLLLGDASFSLYLSHTFVQPVMRRIFPHFFNVDTLAGQAVFIVATTLAACAFAILLYIYCEAKLTRALSNLSKRALS